MFLLFIKPRLMKRVSIPRAPSGASASHPRTSFGLERSQGVSIPRAPSGASARSKRINCPSSIRLTRFNPPGAFGGKCKARVFAVLMRGMRPLFQSPGRLRGQVQAGGARGPRGEQPRQGFNPPGAFGGKCKPRPTSTPSVLPIPVSIPRAPSGASASLGAHAGRRSSSSRKFQSPGRLRGQVQAPPATAATPPTSTTTSFNPPGAFGGKCKRPRFTRRAQAHLRVSIPRAPSGASARRRSC